MEGLLLPGIAAALIIMSAIIGAVRNGHNCDLEMQKNLNECKRTQELVKEATALYPYSSTFNAISFYLEYIENKIITIKSNPNLKILHSELENLFRDKKLLLQEREHLAKLELEMNCDYNLLTQSQL